MRTKLPDGTTIDGEPFWGDTYPAERRPVPPPEDGRTAALSALAEYLGELTFYRPGGVDTRGKDESPIAFQIPKERIYVEWPENVDSLIFPAASLLGNESGNYAAIGFAPQLDESTLDVFGEGTCLRRMSEWIENVMLAVWADTKPERRAIKGGLDQAFAPSERFTGLRLKLPAYYRQTVMFTLLSAQVVEDPDSAKGRRQLQVMIEMRFEVVRLERVRFLHPQITVQTGADPQTGASVSIDRCANNVGE